MLKALLKIMKTFKPLLLTILSLILFAVPANAITRGEKNIGITGGYNTRNTSATAGVFFQYNLSRVVRIAPDITYVFRHDHRDGLGINIDVQFPLSLAGASRLTVYPLAGANYTSWNMHPHNVDSSHESNNDVTTRFNRLGLNLGAGVDYQVTPTMKLFLQGRYTGVRHYSYGGISVGLGYSF